MEVGSLLLWLILFGAIIYGYYRFKSNSNVTALNSMLPFVLFKLLIKLFFVSFVVAWIVLSLADQANHAIVVVVLFYLIGILTLSSLTIFLNLIQGIRFAGFLSGMSFFLLPSLVAVIIYQNPVKQGAEFRFFIISTLVFFGALTYHFIRFRSAVAEE